MPNGKQSEKLALLKNRLNNKKSSLGGQNERENEDLRRSIEDLEAVIADMEASVAESQRLEDKRDNLLTEAFDLSWQKIDQSEKVRDLEGTRYDVEQKKLYYAERRGEVADFILKNLAPYGMGEIVIKGGCQRYLEQNRLIEEEEKNVVKPAPNYEFEAQVLKDMNDRYDKNMSETEELNVQIANNREKDETRLDRLAEAVGKIENGIAAQFDWRAPRTEPETEPSIYEKQAEELSVLGKRLDVTKSLVSSRGSLDDIHDKVREVETALNDVKHAVEEDLGYENERKDLQAEKDRLSREAEAKEKEMLDMSEELQNIVDKKEGLQRERSVCAMIASHKDWGADMLKEAAKCDAELEKQINDADKRFEETNERLKSAGNFVERANERVGEITERIERLDEVLSVSADRNRSIIDNLNDQMGVLDAETERERTERERRAEEDYNRKSTMSPDELYAEDYRLLNADLLRGSGLKDKDIKEMANFSYSMAQGCADFGKTLDKSAEDFQKSGDENKKAKLEGLLSEAQSIRDTVNIMEGKYKDEKKAFDAKAAKAQSERKKLASELSKLEEKRKSVQNDWNKLSEKESKANQEKMELDDKVQKAEFPKSDKWGNWEKFKYNRAISQRDSKMDEILGLEGKLESKRREEMDLDNEIIEKTKAIRKIDMDLKMEDTKLKGKKRAIEQAVRPIKAKLDEIDNLKKVRVDLDKLSGGKEENSEDKNKRNVTPVQNMNRDRNAQMQARSSSH